MPRCLQCGRPQSGHRAYCPACLSEPAEGIAADDVSAAAMSRPAAGVAAETLDASPAERGFVPIARFRNAAEAGYFADELTRDEAFSAVVDLEEALDSFGHYWTTRFVLWVPRGHAESAARQLQQLVDATESDELFATSDAGEMVEPGAMASHLETEDVAESADSGVNWVPIVLTIAAGSMALWVARSMNEQPKRDVRLAPAGGRQIDLWERLSTDTEPWVQESAGGRRELSVSRDRDTAVLREDLDGDGIFERIVPIRRTAPAW